MAGRPPTGDSSLPPAGRNPSLSRGVSTNYAVFLQEGGDNKADTSKREISLIGKPPTAAERSISPPNKGDTLSMLQRSNTKSNADRGVTGGSNTSGFVRDRGASAVNQS